MSLSVEFSLRRWSSGRLDCLGAASRGSFLAVSGQGVPFKISDLDPRGDSSYHRWTGPLECELDATTDKARDWATCIRARYTEDVIAALFETVFREVLAQ